MSPKAAIYFSGKNPTQSSAHNLTKRGFEVSTFNLASVHEPIPPANFFLIDLAAGGNEYENANKVLRRAKALFAKAKILLPPETPKGIKESFKSIYSQVEFETVEFLSNDVKAKKKKIKKHRPKPKPTPAREPRVLTKSPINEKRKPFKKILLVLSALIAWLFALPILLIASTSISLKLSANALTKGQIDKADKFLNTSFGAIKIEEDIIYINSLFPVFGEHLNFFSPTVTFLDKLINISRTGIELSSSAETFIAGFNPKELF